MIIGSWVLGWLVVVHEVLYQGPAVIKEAERGTMLLAAQFVSVP